jgi:hypothetical protein
MLRFHSRDQAHAISACWRAPEFCSAFSNFGYRPISTFPIKEREAKVEGRLHHYQRSTNSRAVTAVLWAGGNCLQTVRAVAPPACPIRQTVARSIIFVGGVLHPELTDWFQGHFPSADVGLQ